MWTVTSNGVGPVRLGMRVPEVEAALGLTPGATGAGECEQRRLAGPVGEVVGMFIGHRLVRIDVVEPGIPTEAGVEAGDTATRVRERYPGVQESPHKYTDGQYLTVTLDGNRRLIFETDGARVTRYRLGQMPEVEWVEGCA